jgi:hypothetical protein
MRALTRAALSGGAWNARGDADRGGSWRQATTMSHAQACRSVGAEVEL